MKPSCSSGHGLIASTPCQKKKQTIGNKGWADLIISAKSGRMKEVHIFANLHLLWRAHARACQRSEKCNDER